MFGAGPAWSAVAPVVDLKVLHAMCGWPLGCKGVCCGFDGRCDGGHVFGLLTRHHGRRPRWVPRTRPQQNHGLEKPLRASGSLVRRIDRSSSGPQDVGNTCPFAIPSAWPKPGSSPRSAASAIATATPSPKPPNGLFKAEVIHRRGPWRNGEAVEFATLEWVQWFNYRLLLEPIGNTPPAEAKARYYAQLEEPAMAA